MARGEICAVGSAPDRNEFLPAGLNHGAVAESRYVLGTPVRSARPLAEWTAGADAPRRRQLHQEALRNGT